MKILSLGSDKSAVDSTSKTAQRIAEYKNLVEEYIVLVPGGGSKVLGFFKLYIEAKKIIKEKKINVVTSQDPYFIGLIAIVLGKKFGTGVEIQVHGWEKFNLIRKTVAKFVLSRANSVRVVSPRIKKQLIEDFGVIESKITVVSVYVDSAEKKGDSPGINKLKIIFLTVGRLVQVKNISLQIEAMKDIVRTNPMIELWVVGEGPERVSLEQQIKYSGLENNVRLIGWSDPEEYYNLADIFLLTSYSEGWPLVIMEAARYGLPIIMTDVGSAGDLIVNNESGIVIPVANKVKLVEAMKNLVNNQELRIVLGQGAREALKRLPTKEENLKLYKESWEKALN